MSSTILQRLYIYQRERFPVLFVLTTTLAVSLSSFAVTGSTFHFVYIVSALLAAFAYILHIRVIDEARDNLHDKKYHKSRPIPRGAITLHELKIVDLFAVVIFVLIAISHGSLTLLIGSIALVYTYLAGKEFFMYEKIRNHFLLYNGINIVQMIILQFFIYALFSVTFYTHAIVWIHLLFIFINSVILEVLRKIKIKKEESPGHDTYSWHLGFEKSLFLHLLLVVSGYTVFLWFLYTASVFTISPFLISLIFIILVVLSTFFHLKARDKKSEGGLYLSTVMMYIGLNFVIFFTLI